MQKKLLILLGILLPLGLIAWALTSPDEPAFTPLKHPSGLELRTYQPYMVAETQVAAAFEGVSDAAYPPLVSYVTGRNGTGRKVPMRAPVRQQQIPGDEGLWRVQFVMPWEYLASMLPPPGDASVTLMQVPAQVLAVRRYRGGWGEARWREEEAALLAAIEAAGLDPIGAPIFARYNPSFVPGFLRRNEVMIEVSLPANP